MTGRPSVGLREFCRERPLPFICQGCGTGSVPRQLPRLDELLVLALDVLGQMRCQRFKVATQLSLCSLPVGKGSLHREGCGDVVRCWIGMAGLCILLDLTERPLWAV